MKVVSIVTTALAGVSAVALAAGPAAAQPATGSVDWTGPYVGLNAGWANPSSHASSTTATTNQVTGASNGLTTVTVPPATFSTAPMRYSDSSWAAGGQVGYNRQMGNLVLGIEGDMDAAGGGARQFSSYALPATGLTTANTVTIDRYTDPNWTADVRGRVGWAMGPVLLYGAGGLALADVKQGAFYTYTPTATAAAAAANPSSAFGPFANGSANDHVLTGWTVGAGAEWRLAPAWSVGAEYRYADYGNPTYRLGSNAPGDTYEATRIGFTDSQVLARINYHFGAGLF